MHDIVWSVTVDGHDSVWRNPLNVALVSMDNSTHCLQVHMNVLLFVLIKCWTNDLSCSDTLINFLWHPCIQGSLSGETREYFPMLCPNIAPTIDQREILLSLSILRSHETYLLANFSTKNDYIQYNFNSWLYKKGNIFWNNISSYWIAKIYHLYKSGIFSNKWNRLGISLCILVSQVISRMCISSRKVVNPCSQE